MEVDRNNAQRDPNNRRADQIAKRVSTRFATLNMNGFGDLVPGSALNKWGTLFKEMKDAKIGVLMLQETHLTIERTLRLEGMFGNRIKIFASLDPETPSAKAGVAFVLNKSLVSTKDASAIEIVPGRALQISIPNQYGEVTHALCIYAPANGNVARATFFQTVLQHYERHPLTPKPTLMAGDFNNTEDAIDRFPTKIPEASIQSLDELKAHLGLMLADGWRMTHPTSVDYTWYGNRTGGARIASRLDRIYTTQGIFNENARDWRIRAPGVRTDHLMQTVSIASQNAPEVGKGRPVFPKCLIKDNKLAKKMKEAGMNAQRQLDSLEQGTTERSIEHNPQTILLNLKNQWMSDARNREKEVVPRILEEIEELRKTRRNLQKNKNMEDLLRVSELQAVAKRLTELRLKRHKQRQAC
ncbi:Endonuclease/exonuclease/phosphatase [Epithele typhae]|uniref:Endonuclease/exonuclease/phosphatase n=1 Tax=Epithele typhae TaxID=378194 RepID=UPI0020085767|nr:Endonuclease/exonuclease/phosphatase [Epithele typhae]KAH9911098.1 Endonuclease/exonuclease/phosphatase [Epithele typhae]